MGIGIEEIIEAVIERIPPPRDYADKAVCVVWFSILFLILTVGLSPTSAVFPAK